MKRRSYITAFSLIEVVISLAVVSFAGIALLGLLGLGLQNNQDSRERTQAATIAEAICATRRAVPTNDLTAIQPGFPLPSLATAANNLTTPIYVTRDGVTNTVANSDFGLLYNIVPTKNIASTGVTSGSALVYVCLFWPAQASPTNPSTGHYELTTTFALP